MKLSFSGLRIGSAKKPKALGKIKNCIKNDLISSLKEIEFSGENLVIKKVGYEQRIKELTDKLNNQKTRSNMQEYLCINNIDKKSINEVIKIESVINNLKVKENGSISSSYNELQNYLTKLEEIKGYFDSLTDYKKKKVRIDKKLLKENKKHIKSVKKQLKLPYSKKKDFKSFHEVLDTLGDLNRDLPSYSKSLKAQIKNEKQKIKQLKKSRKKVKKFIKLLKKEEKTVKS